MRGVRVLKLVGMVVGLLIALNLLSPGGALAIKTKYTGCVIRGKLHCVYKDPTRVEVITVVQVNIRGYEGKKIQIQGDLTPDFYLYNADVVSIRVIGPCDADSKRAIKGMNF